MYLFFPFEELLKLLLSLLCNCGQVRGNYSSVTTDIPVTNVRCWVLRSSLGCGNPGGGVTWDV